MWFGKIRVRVMCPSCGESGSNSIGYQPKCIPCGVLMEPASNNRIECGWTEFVEHVRKTCKLKIETNDR